MSKTIKSEGDGSLPGRTFQSNGAQTGKVRFWVIFEILGGLHFDLHKNYSTTQKHQFHPIHYLSSTINTMVSS
jgi:hypothetical protein